jgi:hypothetical protein
MTELYDTAKRKDLIYDIGMHKGEDTEFYLRKGFRVIAVEAEPSLARFCRFRLKEFIDQGQLIIIEGAIVDPAAIEAGQKKAVFYRNDVNSVWGTVCSDWVQRNVRLGASSTMLEVDVIDFAATLKRYGVPHYMKIDIEGVDMVCVNALRLFRERPDYISIESDKTCFTNIKREIGAFVDLGYDSFQAVEQSAIPRSQSPPNPPREGGYAAQHFEDGSSGLFGMELVNGWKSNREILRQYRVICLGYYLLGDDGIVSRWWGFRWLLRRFLQALTKAPVPGWHDTHARHCSVKTGKF